MRRFIGFRWTPAVPEAKRQALALIEPFERMGHWSRLLDWRGLVVLAAPDERDFAPLVFPGAAGALFGALFRNEDEEGRAVASVDAAEASKLAEDGGASLISRYWGGYLAILVDRAHDLVHLVRDPTGARACYLARLGGVHVFFSHAADYARIARPEPDIVYVASFLINPSRSGRETGLKGVTALLPGERATYARTDMARTLLWRPSAEKSNLEFDTAKMMLKRTAARCVGAWARSAPRILHRLSGGFDSTATLALMTRAAPDTEIICANEYSSEEPQGDERAFARLAARHFGKRLIEIDMRASDVAYECTLSAPLTAAPTLSLLSFADRAFLGAAEAAGAALITSGQAGDHLFHRSRTPLIAADAVWDGTPVSESLRIAMETARLCGKSVWTVAGAMLRHGVLRAPPDLAAYLTHETHWATPEAAEAARACATHDWMMETKMCSPARALRIAHLIDAIRYHDPSAMGERFVCALPLLSQPLVELVLRIAPYVMTHGGRERALARAAFSEDIPAAIARRTMKGATSAYFVAVIKRNAAFLRELLLDGELARHRLIDLAALQAAFKTGAALRGPAIGALLACAAGEIWLQIVDRHRVEAMDAKRAMRG